MTQDPSAEDSGPAENAHDAPRPGARLRQALSAAGHRVDPANPWSTTRPATPSSRPNLDDPFHRAAPARGDAGPAAPREAPSDESLRDLDPSPATPPEAAAPPAAPPTIAPPPASPAAPEASAAMPTSAPVAGAPAAPGAMPTAPTTPAAPTGPTGPTAPEARAAPTTAAPAGPTAAPRTTVEDQEIQVVVDLRPANIALRGPAPARRSEDYGLGNRWGAQWRTATQGWVSEDRERPVWRPVITTTEHLEEWAVDTYLGVVNSEVAVEAAGGDLHQLGATLAHARELGMRGLVEEAVERGAHGVIGVEIQYTPIGDRLLLTITGTAVTLRERV